MSARSLRGDRRRSSPTGSPPGESEDNERPWRTSDHDPQTRRGDRRNRLPVETSASSLHSASSQGSGKGTSGSRQRGAELRRTVSDAGASRAPYTPRTREQRERRPLPPMPDAEELPLEEDSSSNTPRSTRQLSNASAAAEINHEDEIERIREMRARRLRKEQNDSATAAARSKSPRQSEPSSRERRRERELNRQARPANAPPSKFRSTPIISRRELEDAGLVRRERRPVRDANAADASTDIHDDSSAYSQSRARKERLDRLSNDDDVLSAYSRTRRDRQKERTGNDDDTISTYSRSSEKSNTRVPSRPARQTSDPLDPAKDRQAPSRSNTGGDELAQAVAGARPAEKRRIPPTRAKSADHDLLAMDLNRRKEDDPKKRENNKRIERQQQAGLSRTTDLTTRLRERREARAAEREANVDQKGGSITSGHLESEVERRLARRRSSDDVLENMKSSVAHRSIADLELMTLEGANEDAFSVKVRVVSAIDLPQNVIANMPLCPVVKMGFLRVPAGSSNVSESILKTLGSNGVENLRSARVRSTTSKIMSKRDNGTLDFHQELRWDDVVKPSQVALLVEISARAVRTPLNNDQSPPTLVGQSHSATYPHPPQPTKRISTMAATASPKPADEIIDKSEPVRSLQRTASGSDDDLGGGLRAFWRKATNRKAAELEAAEAAAAVARMLVEQDKGAIGVNVHDSSDGTVYDAPPLSNKLPFAPYADYNVALRTSEEKMDPSALTKDVRLGVLVIPLAQLPLEQAGDREGSANLEKWFQIDVMEGDNFSVPPKKLPSLRLEISVARPGVMNEIEDNLDLQPHLSPPTAAKSPSSSLQGKAIQDNKDQAEEDISAEKARVLDPYLEAGVVDFIAVVGCRDIGNQNNDSGAKGWVESTPECVVLEQFPPDNDFHKRAGRKALLPEMVQWFCFPEGTRLWRGIGPPSHADLNLKRFSASSPPNVASSIAAFDACLNCTTSFSWFVIASNSDEYGSKLVKTYGAVIRFYAPAPVGIDPKHEDFAQNVLGGKGLTGRGSTKRLWVPMGICLTSNLPIVGIMEAMLLRLCEDLVSKVVPESGKLANLSDVHKALAHIIVKYQKPIAGAVNCSVPFLAGDRFLLSLPPPTGLPPLPHGKAIVSACRLLGAEGLNFILVAVLTECKILIHSQEIADIAMVAEVVTALIYPFSWSLPYIPILPVGMLEFVEAPLSYMLGVPSHSLQLMDPHALEDVVVIDLDNGFPSSSYYDSKRPLKVGPSKSPPPFPSQVVTNISKAVYKLLRAEEEVDEQYGVSTLGDHHSLPRLEGETLAEREFRVTMAMEICGLLRGYQECLGPVFNRDRFLKIAPALFEDRREHKSGGGFGPGNRVSTQGKVISPRSKRFLSLLVNTQNFHQLLESLENEDITFFHEVMDSFEDSEKFSARAGDVSSREEKALSHLVKTLQKVEDKVPTYRVDKGNETVDVLISEDDFIFDEDGDNVMGEHFPYETDFESSEPDMAVSFTSALLQPTEYKFSNENRAEDSVEEASGYTAVVEKYPWRYQQLFDLQNGSSGALDLLDQEMEQVKLKAAIGERRYRAWKMAQDQKEENDLDLAFAQQTLGASKQGASLDLTTLVSSVTTNDTEVLPAPSNSERLRNAAANPDQQRVADAKDRDIVRRCLDRANQQSEADHLVSEIISNPFVENGRDLLAEAEKALRNPSAQRFLLSILAQRSRLENQRVRANRRQSMSQQASVSRLDHVAFECLIRLSCAILDSSMEYKEYETAYRLLTVTAGFITLSENTGREDPGDKDSATRQVVTMTSKLGLHPIFADLVLWETVMNLHLADRRTERKSDPRLSDAESDDELEENDDELEYESAVATLYEMMGYDIPGEELSRFAMRVSEEKNWFSDDRGRQLLLLARRITVRRDQTETFQGDGDTGIEIMARSQDCDEVPTNNLRSASSSQAGWSEIGWCHPAAPISHMASVSDHLANEVDFLKRSPVTTLASFGQSIVVTGGLDGSVFLAYEIGAQEGSEVRGVHLDWGSASRAGAGVSSDGEYGVGAVSCLAAAPGGGHHGLHTGATNQKPDMPLDEMVNHMDGSRVVAGTTAGDLRVWSVRDICSALLASKNNDDTDGNTKAVTGNSSASTRLKFSLRGRALSGHRGGVTCIDVPSQVYRPDSLVTGGADGLIKLWSLRPPAVGRRQGMLSGAQDGDGTGSREHRGRGGDALCILGGHAGRISCVKTAWHGDRLISGGADETLRLWDLAAAGKCINVLSGHSGWVTHLQHWGPNTIISGSTDRTLAIWDARVSLGPLLMLRHHEAPISDILVGSRTDPVAVSAGADGSLAAWDFRVLSQSLGVNKVFTVESQDDKACNVVRVPRVPMNHCGAGVAMVAAGSVLLCRGPLNPANSILSVGTDAVVREWDISNGQTLNENRTGHCDAVTCFQPCRAGMGLSNISSESDYRSIGTFTASVDGTVRLRRIQQT